MKGFLIKYNLEILTILMFSFVTVVAIFNAAPSITQKILIAYVFLFTLHEWEENRFPGGFVNIMEGMIGNKQYDNRKRLFIGHYLYVCKFCNYAKQSACD